MEFLGVNDDKGLSGKGFTGRTLNGNECACPYSLAVKDLNLEENGTKKFFTPLKTKIFVEPNI